MKRSLSNAYTRRAVTSGMTIPQEWHLVYIVVPATYTLIHKWNELSWSHQMALPEQGGSRLDQLITHLLTPKGWEAELP